MPQFFYCNPLDPVLFYVPLKKDKPVKSFLPRPLLLQEGSPAAGVSFFAPDRLRIQPMPSLKFQKLGLSASNSLKFFSSGIC